MLVCASTACEEASISGTTIFDILVVDYLIPMVRISGGFFLFFFEVHRAKHAGGQGWYFANWLRDYDEQLNDSTRVLSLDSGIAALKVGYYELERLSQRPYYR